MNLIEQFDALNENSVENYKKLVGDIETCTSASELQDLLKYVLSAGLENGSELVKLIRQCIAQLEVIEANKEGKVSARIAEMRKNSEPESTPSIDNDTDISPS